MEFTIEEHFDVSPSELFEAWLDSDEHSDMTGGADALITDEVGEPFHALDGYIWGKTLAIRSDEYIKQTWRTDDFDEDQDYSTVEIFFIPNGNGTLLKIHHSNLKEGDEKYKQGWIDFYFTPMKEYFS